MKAIADNFGEVDPALKDKSLLSDPGNSEYNGSNEQESEKDDGELSSYESGHDDLNIGDQFDIY